jgi:hypothetical protein
MYDFTKDPHTVWKHLKQNSMELVRWTLNPDVEVQASFKAMLGENEPQAKASALSVVIVCACNCIGQLGLHSIAGDEAVRPFLEHRDGRWSPLRLLPAEASRQIGFRVVTDNNFHEREERFLAEVLDEVRRGKSRPARDLVSSVDGAAMFQSLLMLAGSELGKIIDGEGKTFLSLLGEVSEMNGSDDAPHYPFRRKKDDRSRYGSSDFNKRNWLR